MAVAAVKTSTNVPKIPKKRAPENETPRERFKRVATTRLTNVIDGLRLLSTMGPSREYDFNESDANKLIELITKQLADTKTALLTRKAEAKGVSGLFD